MRAMLGCGAAGLLLVVTGAAACASTGHRTPGDRTGGNGNLAGGGGQGDNTLGNCITLARGCSSSCTDFPSAPLVDAAPEDGSPATPAGAASFFAASDGGGSGPCIVEPAAGTLIPQNWVRPRFRVIPVAGQNLFEIDLHTQRQASDYVVYTTSTTWTVPKTVWDGLRGDSWGDEVSVTIRGVDTSASQPPTSSTSSFTIAPAGAGGAMVYWAATGDQNGMSWLEGFAPGDEGVATTLEVGQVQARLYRDQSGTVQDNGAPQCIGCHAAVPDGNSVTFADFWPWPGSSARVDPGSTGLIPSWLTPGGAQTLSMPWLGIAAFSKADWSDEQVAITSFGCGAPTPGNQQTYPWSGATCSDQPNSALAWIDLGASTAVSEAGSGSQLGQAVMGDLGTSWGILARTGDSRGAEFPSWSHDGATIVYVSTNAGKDGRLASGEADLYTIPFAARAGGAATPVQGASDPNADEYYPSYSEDDQLIAFDRSTTDGQAEVYVVPASGASSPTRLAANDPPSCQGTPGSPGVTNSWPKWSPDVEVCPDGNTYYWLVFSSTREGIPFLDNSTNFKSMPDGPTSQLYITAVVVGNGQITTYPALYIWNQATVSASHAGSPQSNHTPIWEVVNIPRSTIQ